MLEGRLFNAQDTEKSPLVVIVDQEFVARSFPNQPAREVLGKRLRFGGDSDGWREIVGVVGHVKQSGLNEESRAQIYRPWTQITPKWKADFTRATDMIVKTSVEPYSLVGAIKREIRVIDKDQPIAQVQTLGDKLSDSLAPQRFTLLLLGIFALIALLLASAGIYGVMSYAVTQRTHEIGVRMALGARQLDVLKLMVRQGMSLVVIGVVLGLAGAFATTRLMTSLLFDVTAKDPVTFSVGHRCADDRGIGRLLHSGATGNESRSAGGAAIRIGLRSLVLGLWSWCTWFFVLGSLLFAAGLEIYCRKTPE